MIFAWIIFVLLAVATTGVFLYAPTARAPEGHCQLCRRGHLPPWESICRDCAENL